MAAILTSSLVSPQKRSGAIDAASLALCLQAVSASAHAEVLPSFPSQMECSQ
jgi:hypothetical protein